MRGDVVVVTPSTPAMAFQPGQAVEAVLHAGVYIDRGTTDFSAQLARLDIEDGDILTVRTRAKLTAEKATRYQRELLELCRSQGFQHVSVIILDDCSDLTIERPRKAPTGMQHQAARPSAKTSY